MMIPLHRPSRAARVPCPGWDLVVKPSLLGSELTQLDERRVRIVLPPFEAYDLRSAETLRLHVPREALQTDHAVRASPDVEITAIPGTAAYSGFVEYDRTEKAVRAGVSVQWSVEQTALLTEPMRLTVTLADDEWADLVGSEAEASWRFLAALLSEQAEAAGDRYFAAACPVCSNAHCAQMPIVLKCPVCSNAHCAQMPSVLKCAVCSNAPCAAEPLMAPDHGPCDLAMARAALISHVAGFHDP